MAASNAGEEPEVGVAVGVVKVQADVGLEPPVGFVLQRGQVGAGNVDAARGAAHRSAIYGPGVMTSSAVTGADLGPPTVPMVSRGGGNGRGNMYHIATTDRPSRRR